MNIQDFIKEQANHIIGNMIESPEIEVHEEDEVYYVTVKTQDAATIIGRHGETIRAIQKILEVMLYKHAQQSVQILVNVNDFREKQQEQLEETAKEAAEEVLATSEAAHLRGLSAFERKLVHQFITTNYAELTTQSIGEGRDRHLVVSLASDETAQEEA